MNRIAKLESKLITDEQAMDTLYCDIKQLRELLTATIDTMQGCVMEDDAIKLNQFGNTSKYIITKIK